MNLTLHKTEPKQTLDLCQIHLEATFRCMQRFEDTGVHTDLLKIVNHGVRAAKGLMKRLGPQLLFWFCESVKDYISLMTPMELMQVFPIDKEYDGERWQSKDYFYTLQVLRNHGLHTPIGEQVTELLWDYMSHHMRFFMVVLMGAASDLKREQTGTGIMEDWCREQGIPTYRMCKDPDTGNEFMLDSESGRSIGVKRVVPRHLTVLS